VTSGNYQRCCDLGIHFPQHLAAGLQRATSRSPAPSSSAPSRHHWFVLLGWCAESSKRVGANPIGVSEYPEWLLRPIPRRADALVLRVEHNRRDDHCDQGGTTGESYGDSSAHVTKLRRRSVSVLIYRLICRFPVRFKNANGASSHELSSFSFLVSLVHITKRIPRRDNDTVPKARAYL
jgi:hypothetical protein